MAGIHMEGRAGILIWRLSQMIHWESLEVREQQLQAGLQTFWVPCPLWVSVSPSIKGEVGGDGVEVRPQGEPIPNFHLCCCLYW